MNLSFMTNFKNGKPTYFVEKIWEGFNWKKTSNTDILNECYDRGFTDVLKNGVHYPKFHTIREDKNERWREGMKIHFLINARNKYRFQFAPLRYCEEVQEIEIKRNGLDVELFIDGKPKYTRLVNTHDGLMLSQAPGFDIEAFARNDGFKDSTAFFEYFDKCFKGRIIHWHGIRY